MDMIVEKMKNVSQVSFSSNQVREDLATAYQLLAKLGLDDLTYTHLSARVPGEDSFFIHPLGLLFDEVTPQNLLRVSFDGNVCEGSEMAPNRTGFIIHSSIYKARKDIMAIFHLHTPSGVAVSSLKGGLRPMSQFSFHFYEQMGYHRYDALALDAWRHGDQLVKDLGPHYNMMLENHGTISCGKTIHQALFYSYYLEQACQVQLKAMATGAECIYPTSEVCAQASRDMRQFEPDLGRRDWEALKRRYQL